ncbi:Predicted permease [Serratia marcescens]|nr:Predicted permease [Serratia marcescens]
MENRSCFCWWWPSASTTVKWQPYYGKAFVAADSHSIGKSILADGAGSPWLAAWQYALVYFTAVWKAALLGVLLGSLVQVLIPRDWLARTLGHRRFSGTVLGALIALPGMMCTCCAAPVAAGMRRQSVSSGAALAFWLANPVLNPATLVFMGFVLGWPFAAIRLVAGVVMVLGHRLAGAARDRQRPAARHAAAAGDDGAER